MFNKKLYSTLTLATFLVTTFAVPFSVKADTLSSKQLALDDLKKSAGSSFKFFKDSSNDNQIFISGKLSKRKAASSKEALAFINEIKGVLSLKNVSKNFKASSIKKDELGFTHVTLEQLSNGIPVEGSSITVHFDKDNNITNVTSNVNYKILNGFNSSKKVISKETVKKFLEKKFASNNSQITFKSEEVINEGSKIYSTYKFNVYYQQPEIQNNDVYVDVQTGKIVKEESLIRYGTPVTGSGTAVNGTTRSLNLYKTGNSYKTKDVTKDMKGIIVTYTAKNKEFQPGIVYSSPSKTVSDAAIVSAHAYAGVVYDFYKKIFNRNSIDGKGMNLISTAHYGKKYNNAFWDGRQMVYGDGDGVNFTQFSGDLDVVAHEMTHGVTTNTADLKYQDQSGALNESMSDVFGVLIQTWDKYNVYNGGTWKFDPADWVIGDEIYTPGKSGDALRSLAEPTLYKQPDNLSDYYNTSSDHGGVHTNSGIPNKAAYLIAKSIGCEKVAKIYYRALSTYFNKNTNFQGALNGLVQSATDLYGADSSEVKSIKDSYNAVGISSEASSQPKDSYEPNDSIDSAYEISSGTSYKSYISNSSDLDYYKIYIPSSKTLDITLSDLPQDYDLYLYNSNGLNVAKSRASSTNNEKISYKPFKAGYYYILVCGYNGSYSTSPYTLKCTIN